MAHGVARGLFFARIGVQLPVASPNRIGNASGGIPRRHFAPFLSPYFM